MRCIVGSRCACLDHLCDHMIELCGISARDHRSSETLFQIPPGIPGNGSAGLCDSFVGIESLGPFLLRQFACGDLGELIESEFCSAHVVTETLFLETLEVLILPGGHTGPGAGKLVGQNSIFFALLYAAAFPFVGEFFAGADRLETLIDPFLSVSGALVGGDKAVSNQFWIKGFLDAFPANLSQPQLEGFGFL